MPNIVMRCKKTDRVFVNSEIQKNSSGSPFVWTQETVIGMALKAYRQIRQIKEAMPRRYTDENKLQYIQDILSS